MKFLICCWLLMVAVAAHATLPPVRGSVALSDRTSMAIFEVKRNGEVVRFRDDPVDHAVGEDGSPRFEEKLFTLKEPFGAWRWQEGYLPILQIGDGTELVAEGDCLHVREGASFAVYPGAKKSEAKTFDAVRNRVARYWHDWFARGRILPPIDPFTDAAWRSSLVQALCCYSNRHPHYGPGKYYAATHAGFPPTTIAMVETLLQYRHVDEAVDFFLYYLRRFVRADGTIAYYGPSLSEYGGLMRTAALVAEASPAKRGEIAATLRPLVQMILSRYPQHMPNTLLGSNLLLCGSPEADTRRDRREYFHNNFQVLLGLRCVGAMYAANDERELSGEIANMAETLERRVRLVYGRARRRLGGVPFEPNQTNLVDDIQRDLTTTFANYRYYPEMLETGFLSKDDAEAFCAYRENHNGEWQGMCQFTLCEKWGHEVDNWPMASYARGLLAYGMTNRFERVLKAHLHHYISNDTFTAYEQIWNHGDPRPGAAPPCVPVLLVLPRLLGWKYGAGCSPRSSRRSAPPLIRP